MDPQTSASFMAIAMIFGIVLIICWIVLPFAIIGTKPLLRSLLREQQRTNELLDQLTGRGGQASTSRPVEHRYPPSPAPSSPRFAGSPNLPPT